MDKTISEGLCGRVVWQRERGVQRVIIWASEGATFLLHGPKINPTQLYELYLLNRPVHCLVSVTNVGPLNPEGCGDKTYGPVGEWDKY